MENSKKIIAYDLGTGGIKASLFQTDCRPCAHTFIPYETYYTGTDFHEQNPGDWWQGIIQSTKELMNHTGTCPEDIAALSISGHSLSVVPIDKNGRLLKDRIPIWSDTRASAQAEHFFNTVSYEDWYMHTGNGFPPECYSIFKIMWYKDNEPEMFEKTYKILGSKDYCNFRLTGRCCTDYSYASGSGVYDLKKHAYIEEYLHHAGIKTCLLPEILPSHATVGTLTKEAADALCLPASVKVICGGVDNSCMALGAKGTEDGRTYTSLGSSSWIAVIGKEPILDFKCKPFVFEHCIEGLYTSATSIFSAGNSFRWVRDVICSELLSQEKEGTIKDAYTIMNEMILQSPIGAKKLIFNPSMAGGSMFEENKDIVAGYVGLTLGHTKNDLVRAAMEGITFNLKYAMDLLSQYRPGLSQMLLAGGGSKSPVWRQMFADIFDMEIIKTNIDQDAASLGAAALAAYGLGFIDSYDVLDSIHKVDAVAVPDPDHKKTYARLYPLHREISHYMALAGQHLHELSV